MKRNNSNNTKNYNTYQSGYRPPVHYANDQTKSLEDTTKTFYQADDTAGRVLDQMTAQRQQLEGAHTNVWEMRQATEKAKREIQELQTKYRERKQRLYVWIFVLGLTDLLLLLRIFQCRGNFFC